MDERKRNTREFYDFISDTYDHRMSTPLGLSARLAEVLVREANIPEGARVLDVGTGTGNVALAAARAVGQRGRGLTSITGGLDFNHRRKFQFRHTSAPAGE